MNTSTAVPPEVINLIDIPQYCVVSDIEVNTVSIRTMCAAVQNSNPVYWDRDVALEKMGAQLAPASMLATWGRPELWAPSRDEELRALQLHFDLKELLNLPFSIVASFETVFYAPAVVGDLLRTQQVLKSIGETKKTRLGSGRFWTIEMEYFDSTDQLVGVDIFNFFAYGNQEY